MALIKAVESTDERTLNYHRVASVLIITNNKNVIEIDSYTSKKKREEERAWYEEASERLAAIKKSDDEKTDADKQLLSVPQKSMNVYIDATYLNTDYDPTMTVDSAYAYLKTTDMYKDAEDD